MTITNWTNWDAQAMNDDFWIALDHLERERLHERRAAQQDAAEQRRRQNRLAARKIDFERIARELALARDPAEAG